ncbi:DTW domain-containing protein [Thiomicrorhabdus sp. 6S2-11]|uniref:tRNA-uridine aminocarboxypropyltransferase n=1 Tax=Thiomicrorhabdus marina TaxID=2818442 RepID=A0ABS3Q4S6_9GAMM|nr:tRNA-uridine aminocarboxypropyltransferase [Thiomicrorhabdus marina]MBO1927168.1 DTW domain-containing protein [Thiomicrorhabdus marina]
MARELCAQCNRPLSACWCHCRLLIDNQVEVGILQHPTEQKQVKSTVPLLLSCLQKQFAWVGEQIENTQLLAETDISLQEWLDNPKKTYLLYPATEDENITVVEAKQLQEPAQQLQVLVLDGTWRKTFKMLQLNPVLQRLPRISIRAQQVSQYSIRKQKDEGSLSTIEAVGQLLTEVENQPEITEKLNQAFICFQEAVFPYIKKS